MKRITLILMLFLIPLASGTGDIRVLYDDLTLGNHSICVYQQTNWTNNVTNVTTNKYSLIKCFQSGQTYSYLRTNSTKISENCTYIVKIERQKIDYISSPEKLQTGLFHNLGYLISFIVIIVISIIIYKKVK